MRENLCLHVNFSFRQRRSRAESKNRNENKGKIVKYCISQFITLCVRACDLLAHNNKRVKKQRRQRVCAPNYLNIWMLGLKYNEIDDYVHVRFRHIIDDSVLLFLLSRPLPVSSIFYACYFPNACVYKQSREIYITHLYAFIIKSLLKSWWRVASEFSAIFFSFQHTRERYILPPIPCLASYHRCLSRSYAKIIFRSLSLFALCYSWFPCVHFLSHSILNFYCYLIRILCSNSNHLSGKAKKIYIILNINIPYTPGLFTYLLMLLLYSSS